MVEDLAQVKRDKFTIQALVYNCQHNIQYQSDYEKFMVGLLAYKDFNGIPSQYLLDHASAEKSNHVIISKGEGNKQQPLQILDTPPGNGKQPLYILDTRDRILEVVVFVTPPDVYENVYRPKLLAFKQPISSSNILVSSANGTTFEMQAIFSDMWEDEPGDDGEGEGCSVDSDGTYYDSPTDVHDSPRNCNTKDELNEEMANDSMPMLGSPRIDGRNFYEDDNQNRVDTRVTQEVNCQDIENEELEDTAPGINSQGIFGGTPSTVLGLEDIMRDLGDIMCTLEDRFRGYPNGWMSSGML
ncbi:hypothetical protein FRX31_014661 [Thalictrum thalictroides]|uniref:Uncharacterized protein n=1 Tax=Thalictrum thalictroides TaxID=46969 RepID=A0A7J6WI32_THATH|nr:hypothetical protein FRX31_014661 [Thalictrum thalictroides]